MARPGIQKHLDIAPLLRCPLCHAAMRATGSSVRCERGHDFAVSSKGFLNLVPNQPPLKGYDEEFFASRRRVMERGYYDCVKRALLDAVASEGFTPDASSPSGGKGARPVILDAGCGEGTYAKALGDALGETADSTRRGTVIGMDLARDGVRCAARGGGPERWLVADLANIPLADGSVDVIANVFTPANYAEFGRVLKPSGILIKVIPASGHMRELRRLAGDRLRHAGFSDHGVAEHLERHMRVRSRLRVTGTSDVSPKDAPDLIRMSPVAFGLGESEIDACALTRITVDAEVLVAQVGEEA